MLAGVQAMNSLRSAMLQKSSTVVEKEMETDLARME